MYGASIGTLNVLMKYSAGITSLAEKVVWSLSGNEGQAWKAASVPISSTRDFQVSAVLFKNDFTIKAFCYWQSSLEAYYYCLSYRLFMHNILND